MSGTDGGQGGGPVPRHARPTKDAIRVSRRVVDVLQRFKNGVKNVFTLDKSPRHSSYPHPAPYPLAGPPPDIPPARGLTMMRASTSMSTSSIIRSSTRPTRPARQGKGIQSPPPPPPPRTDGRKATDPHAPPTPHSSILFHRYALIYPIYSHYLPKIPIHLVPTLSAPHAAHSPIPTAQPHSPPHVQSAPTSPPRPPRSGPPPAAPPPRT